MKEREKILKQKAMLLLRIYENFSDENVEKLLTIVTLIAFCLLFSTVRFQMSPQIACVSGCIITLVAFDFAPLCVFRRILKV